MLNVDLIVVHAGELVQGARTSTDLSPRRGPSLSEMNIISDGALAVREGSIVWLGKSDEVDSHVRLMPDGRSLDARGRVVTPGLVDAHTHPVFAATRAAEFAMRCEGKSYQQIAAEGGGIASSVSKTRATSEELLFERAVKIADRMLDSGTTTAEAKSGYGLTLEDELKMLRVIRRVNENHAIDWIPTAMPAHDIPVEYRSDPDAYVGLIVAEILPAIAREQLAKFNDVFFETGVFNGEQTRQVQSRARELGFALKFHVDELSDVGGAQLAVEMSAVSADHLVYISDNGIGALAASSTIAIMLPGTAYFLDLPRKPPVRAMIERGVAVAVATDCNPGSNMCESMTMAMNQACVLYKMSPAEALISATYNAACAVQSQQRVGSLEVGKDCDAVIWDATDYRELAYHYGASLAECVIKTGRVVRESR